MIPFAQRCTRYRKMIGLRRDGLLPPEDERALRRHLAGCESCRVAQDITNMLGEELRSAPGVETAPDFDDRVMAALAVRRRRQSFRFHWREFAVATCAAAVMLGLTLQYVATPETIVRPTPSPFGAASVDPRSITEPVLKDPNRPFWYQTEPPKEDSRPVEEATQPAG